MILWYLGILFLTATVGFAQKCKDDARLKNIEVFTKQDIISNLNYTLNNVGQGLFKFDFTVTLKQNIPGSSKGQAVLKPKMIPSIPLMYGMKLEKAMQHDMMKIVTECSNFKAVVPVEKGKYKGSCTINVAWGIPLLPKEGTGTMTLTLDKTVLTSAKAKVEKFKNCDLN